MDESRQWFKSSYGIGEVRETSRDHAFCAFTILKDHVLQIPDATIDPRFSHNPLVTGSPDIRFYAGAPLTVSPGLNMGTLCVIDRKAGTLTKEQLRSLEGLADVVVEALLLRHELKTDK